MNKLKTQDIETAGKQEIMITIKGNHAKYIGKYWKDTVKEI